MRQRKKSLLALCPCSPVLIWVLLWCSLFLSGCAGKWFGGDTAPETAPLAAEGSPAQKSPLAENMRYASRVDVQGENIPPELQQNMEAASLLRKLEKEPPDDMQGLSFRVDKDKAEAQRLMQALGWYAGRVESRVEKTAAAPHDEKNTPAAYDSRASRQNPPPLTVHMTLIPGARYSVGETVVYYTHSTRNTEENTEITQPSAAKPASQSATPVSTAATPALGSAATPVATPAPDSGAAKPLPPDAPHTLADVGLKPGSVAVADAVLTAVDALPDYLSRRGYPLAKVVNTRHSVDHEEQKLYTAVTVDTGPRVRMGRVRVQGESNVNHEYIASLQSWEQQPWWDSAEAERYRDSLVRQGLFRSVRVEAVPPAVVPAAVPATLSPTLPSTVTPTHATTPLATGEARPIAASSASALSPPVAAAVTPTVTAPAPVTSLPTALAVDATVSVTDAMTAKPAASSATPVYDLLVTVADAPQRTVGGGVNYESERGLGVQAYWEHRNIFGQGERLRTEASVWNDTQYAKAQLRKPAFLDRKQELVGEAWLRNEDTRAYRQKAALASGALERRLWSRWVASAGVSAEGGELSDSQHDSQGYTMTGLPLTLRYEGQGEVLDPVRGWRGSLSVKPTWGYYGQSFTVVPTRLTLRAYWPLGLMDEVNDIHRVVLAGRVATGTLWRGDSQTIPAAARYYGGGGGSVRGYAYQSLGPRDKWDDPLGGSSFAELSLEARVRITKDISIVPFLDGGNVYEGVTPDVLGPDGMRWGAGLGLRYHTPIGPVRLDVATPLNPRSNDGPFALYISIGQSF